MRCLDQVKILEILRLWEEGHSQRDIGISVKCGKSTVGDIQRRCREQGLGYEEAQKLTNAEIKERLYPALTSMPIKNDPEWKDIHSRLKAHRRLNLQYIWEEEYRVANPDGLSYSQFCRRYHQWREKTGKEVVMVQEREPGKELFVDWMGDVLPCVVDPSTGEMIEAHFFVSTLGDSSYPYVEAFPDEKQASWTAAHIHAFEWIGGTPRVVVPDNTTTAITKPDYYDPKLNPAYYELARHYNVAVIPARIRKPRDKSPVESGIGWLETWLVEWLRGKHFLSFDELNREIIKRVKKLAKREFKLRAGSRESIFELVDKPALRPLPSSRFEYAEYAFRRVPDNYHVEWNSRYYSVPYTLYRQQVTLRVTANVIEIINDNRERVALHQISNSGSRYITNPAHMPKNHKHQWEFNKKDSGDYRSWAKTVGTNTFSLIDTMLNAQHVEETAYKSCMGVLQFGRKYDNEQLENACAKAIKIGSPTYTTVKNIMKKIVPTEKVNPLPDHENLRDPHEFV